jgi:GTP-sensing pleiotropic transcriptional regulator CodY
MAQMSDTAIKQVLRILRKNGTGGQVITNVAKQYGVTESVIRACGQAITETASVTESDASGSAGPNSRDVRETFLAEQLSAQVTAAESKPLPECTTQDLEAIAAARFGR